MDEKHCHQCASSCSTPSVHQTLDEMDFEKGIWTAALDGNIAKIKSLLEKRADVNARDTAGYTALHYAARQGEMDVVRLLLENNSNVNATTRAGGLTALHRAAHQGHNEIVKILLTKGAVADIQDADGKTALHKAAENGKFVACKLLIDHQPELKSIPDNRGRKPCDLTINEALKNILNCNS